VVPRPRHTLLKSGSYAVSLVLSLRSAAARRGATAAGGFSLSRMFHGQWGFQEMPQVFLETYRCYSMSVAGKEEKEGGDKIILPSSAFEKLARMHITYPMQFELRNDSMMDLSGDPEARPMRTHVGVLEFTAQEGRCFVPFWIMQNLLLPEGAFLQVRNVTLPLASSLTFRPKSEDFLEISNPKAVLESVLRNFSCVTKKDTICLPYNGRNYYLDIVDVKPQEACSIVEADVRVEFESPPGYQEKLDARKAAAAAEAAAAGAAAAAAALPPVAPAGAGAGAGVGSATGPGAASASSQMLADLAKAREARKAQLESAKAGYVSFSGAGRRIDGKKKGEEENPTLAEQLGGVAAPVETARKGKWKSKTQGALFVGEGQTLK
jgi:ubiquitin fusion degradation protein 1